MSCRKVKIAIYIGAGGGVVGGCGVWICVRRCERCKRVTVPPNHPGGVANL